MHVRGSRRKHSCHGLRDALAEQYVGAVSRRLRRCLLLKSVTGRFGSKAPIRFLNQRPFDQLFTWLGSPIFERPLCRFLHCDCDDEQRLLWPSRWSFPTRVFWGMNGRSWPIAAERMRETWGERRRCSRCGLHMPYPQTCVDPLIASTVCSS